MILIQLTAGLVCGVIAAVIASNKGRSPVGWFFGGFFLGIVGIIVVAVLSNPKAERSYRARIENENRRLREQMRQERVKGETFRQYSMNRLDAHDGALGMDTRSLAAGAPSAGTPQLDWSVGTAAPPADPTFPNWYYECRGETRGPVAAESLQALIVANEITPQTLVWSEGMADWAPLQTVASLNPGRPL